LNTPYRRTIIALAIVCAGACVFLFNLFYREAEKIALRKLNEEQRIHAKQAAQGIEDFFVTWTRNLSALAKMEQVMDNDAVGQRCLNRFYESNQEQILAITRLDERGVIIHNFPDSRSTGIDISEQKHVRELLRDRKPVISDVFKAVEGVNAVALHVPIFKGSEFKGSVGILIDFKSISHRYLDVIKISDTGYAWVVSRDGTILYTPIPGFIGKSVFEISQESPSLQVMVNDMLQGHEGAASYTFDRIGDRNVGPIKKYAVYVPVYIEHTFWSIAVASAEQDVLSGLISFRNKLALVVVALFVCGMVLLTLGTKAWLIVKEEEKRKLTEDKLRESEERMTLASEAAGFGVWMWRIARNQIWGSERWLDLFGFAPDATVTFENVIQRIHPNDREMVERAVRRALEERGDYAGEYRVVLPDNTQRWVVARGRVYPDTQGKPDRMMGATIDITARKQLEESNRNEQELMAAVFNSVPGLLYLYTEDGRLVRWNRQHEEMTGYMSEELLNFPIQNWFVNEDQIQLANEFSKVFSEGFTQVELNLILKDGRKMPVFATGSKVIIDGKPHLVGIAIDISVRKRAEQEIQQQRNELAHLSRVTMLGELSGSLAHELNQPLTAILSNAQAAQRFLAHDTPDFAELRDILADIVAEDKRAGEVIRRLRLLLKKGEVQHQPFDLNEVVWEVLKLVRSDLVNQGVVVQTELAPALPAVNSDRVQLQQVLLNLVMNACDAMAGNLAADRKLIIRTALAGGEGIRVSVADRGVGLGAENLEKVFEPFFTTKAQGMGLGLSVCRTIISAHGGKLGAANNPERGATFSFTLPASPEPNP
jgi:two-component system, cell cycle sensor histidine kinase and response regulator CckA